jgi:hypothetical protein
LRAPFRSAAACRRFHAGSLLPAAAASRGQQSGAKWRWPREDMPWDETFEIVLRQQNLTWKMKKDVITIKE